MGNAISVVQLWIICVISQNWRPDVRCGDVMTRMLKSTWCAAGTSFQEWSIALVGMPEVWPCDAASRSLGNQGYIRNLGRSPPGTSSCVETLWGTRCPRRHTCKSCLSHDCTIASSPLAEMDVCLDRMAAPILPRREEPDINTLCPQSTFQELPVMGKEYASLDRSWPPVLGSGVRHVLEESFLNFSRVTERFS